MITFILKNPPPPPKYSLFFLHLIHLPPPRVKICLHVQTITFSSRNKTITTLFLLTLELFSFIFTALLFCHFQQCLSSSVSNLRIRLAFHFTVPLEFVFSPSPPIHVAHALLDIGVCGGGALEQIGF